MNIIPLKWSIQLGHIQKVASINLLWAIVIYLVVSIPVALMNSRFAKSKGQSKVFWSLFSFIPLVGSLIAPLYLMTLPDKEILEKINKLNNTEKELTKNPKKKSIPPTLNQGGWILM